MSGELPSPKRRRQEGGVVSACKTCANCRRKKTRCDSARPTCRSCASSGSDCVYVEDTRRLVRPSWAVVQRLEESVAVLAERVQQAEARADSMASSKPPGTQPQPVIESAAAPAEDDPVPHEVAPPSIPERPHPDPTSRDAYGSTTSAAREDARTADELSPQELSVAGFVQTHDGAVAVHGIASLLHANTPAKIAPPKLQSKHYQDQEREGTQARLVSNAALQRQRELRLFRGPCYNIDLDGIDWDTAKHLFDLHWNRQHYAYLLTYRPAVMDSMANCGPWANKLLLNAIYYSSAVYSDRACFRPADPGGMIGVQFFYRFKELLVDALVEPSITSAAALLLMGSNMTSQGHLSAGWNFCGLAYRMIVDLGGHLMTAPKQPSIANGNIQRDIERELRKRVYWGAFIIDTTQSMYFGRPTSLPLAEARVPTELLDTFEELEEWTPYVDSMMKLPSDELLISYMPQPVYAVSTFLGLARLFRIGSRIVRAFYSLDSIRLAPNHANDIKNDFQRELSEWFAALPEHLRFNPDTDQTPPPHQINPHTSYHTLIILLKRPFSKTGHLRHCISDLARAKDAEECVASALMIWKLVAAYRNAFTLRRAAYLIVYAMYSAVLVLLANSKDDRSRHTSPISFFWSSLSEQRQWFAGLHKPIAIIRDMMKEFGHTGVLAENAQLPTAVPDGPSNLFSNNELQTMGELGHYDAMGSAETGNIMFSNDFDYSSFEFLESNERIISDDALFGLFAPHQELV